MSFQITYVSFPMTWGKPKWPFTIQFRNKDGGPLQYKLPSGKLT